MSTAPVIKTPRLTLRGYAMEDLQTLWAFFQSPRAAYVDAPTNLSHTWYGFSSEVASWVLKGHGGWSVCLADGRLVGQVAISQPPHFPELEIGWIFFEGFEGKGYATEAATAALDWAWANLNADTLVSYIDPRNTRSIALATRLGATLDPDARRPGDETPDQCSVYRHRGTA